MDPVKVTKDIPSAGHPSAPPSGPDISRTPSVSLPQASAAGPILDQAASLLPPIPTAPSPSLPKGGGAVRSLSEKSNVDLVTGAVSLAVPIPTSSSRGGYSPGLGLTYSSSQGNGPFGLGWSLSSVTSIQRRTEKGVPRYLDGGQDEDVFTFSGMDDLVPVLDVDAGGQWVLPDPSSRSFRGVQYKVSRFRPRIESAFSRIERWTPVDAAAPARVHWRAISKENVTTLFGFEADSCISDPADPTGERIFRWLICQSFDDRGNAVSWTYKTEDSAGVNLRAANERNRSEAARTGNRYLKRIKYGNKAPYLDPEVSLDGMEWLFEVVFDFGEHDLHNPSSLAEPNTWLCRQDPMSSWTSGFEIRTYRLCQRVLMFHHFADEDIGSDCLVSSVDFAYRGGPMGEQTLSVLESVTRCGYRRKIGNSTYIKRSMPPLEMSYTAPVIQDSAQEMDEASLQGLPGGFYGDTYRWFDLESEGIPGILATVGKSLFYKHNLGNGQLQPIEQLPLQPNLGLSGDAKMQWYDVEGDGRACCVLLGGLNGYFRRAIGGGWHPFQQFQRTPNLPLGKGISGMIMMDCNGDGLTDILIFGDDHVVLYQSLGKEGFDAPILGSIALNEEQGPRTLVTNNTAAILTADMSGDGLGDIVRIRNGEICYWPNMGYGRFGPIIEMDNAPWFDFVDMFNPGNLRLGDIDGSGTSDLLYIGSSGIKVYLNQAGNSWREGPLLESIPRSTNLSTLQLVDLLGNGTSSVVWSSQLPNETRLCYLNLTGPVKPHLLSTYRNNLGAETNFQYASSTQFYLDDKRKGVEWITKLPFPVHVVESVENRDLIRNNRFVKRYAYHHGYYDTVEREFRGFGMVEQWDTELFEVTGDPSDKLASQVPPVYTKTWFHTGAYIHRQRLEREFAKQYFKEATSRDDILLPDTIFPSQIWLPNGSSTAYALSPVDRVEACRALKGSILRREIYGLDGSDIQSRPYLVSERNYSIEMYQPCQSERLNAIFFTHAREMVDFYYERQTYSVGGNQVFDPRIVHGCVLESDSYGNTLSTATVTYRRRHTDSGPILSDDDKIVQRQTRMITMHVQYTNALAETDSAYRSPMPAEVLCHEIFGLPEVDSSSKLFSFQDLQGIITSSGDGLHDLPFQDFEGAGAVTAHSYRRLIQQNRILFRNNDLSQNLPLGTLQSLAIPFQSYKKVFTQSLLSDIYIQTGKVAPGDLNSIFVRDAGYLDLDGDGSLWAPSGLSFYSPGTNDSSATELAYARSHFFTLCRFRTPFHTAALPSETYINYDTYDLLVEETRDSLGTRISVGERNSNPDLPLVKRGNDYRLLQPARIMDPNRNRSEVAFDTLGNVVATAIKGKPNETLGDDASAINVDMTDVELADYFSDPLGSSSNLLGAATTRIIYDPHAFYKTMNSPQPSPPFSSTLVREIHTSDLAPGETSEIAISISYFDGLMRVIQQRVLSDPGPENPRIPDATGPEPSLPDLNPRWITSGWTILNNKDLPFRQYEPFFSSTHQYRTAAVVGVSQIMFYDPLSRALGTVYPNHTWTKIARDAWTGEIWDVNDTASIPDPKSDVELGFYFRRLQDSDYLPTWYASRITGGMGVQERRAAEKTAAHAATPSVHFFDSLGNIYIAAENCKNDQVGVDSWFLTKTVSDIEGTPREAVDATGRLAMTWQVDMLKNTIQLNSADASSRWTLQDIMGQSSCSWDSRNHRLRFTYDQIRRHIGTFLKDGANAEVQTEKLQYGILGPASETANTVSKLIRSSDQGGQVTTQSYDFKGNPGQKVTRLAQDFKNTLDWSGPVALELDEYLSFAKYDAMNRQIQQVCADSSIIYSYYNKSGSVKRVAVQLRSESSPTDYISGIKYNARGQRMAATFGKAATTYHNYDDKTFRLTAILTKRDAGKYPDDSQDPPPADWPGFQIQNLNNVYDPIGNPTFTNDSSQQTIFFRNKRVDPSNDYTYDSCYRLIKATGREHLGQTGDGPGPFNDWMRPIDNPEDGKAMARYDEIYTYDSVSNILSMQHITYDTHQHGWTRTYQYNEPSILEPTAKFNNRLTSTSIGNVSDLYRYGGPGGEHGSIVRMPGLELLQWNYMDELKATVPKLGAAAETTWYVYDSTGGRVRKVTERQDSAGRNFRRHERIYIDGVEYFKTYDGQGNQTLVRETLHVRDGRRDIAIVQTRTFGIEVGIPAQLRRYQFGNNLGSVSLELDDQGKFISYEEYTPYSTTSYYAVDSQTQTPKRYRYLGKERDEESGFYFHGARYQAPWLGRWISCDPMGIKDGINPYEFTHSNPMAWTDSRGTDCDPQNASCTVSNNPADYKTLEEWKSNAPLVMTEEATVMAWSDAHGINSSRIAPDEKSVPPPTSKEPAPPPQDAPAEQPSGGSRFGGAMKMLGGGLEMAFGGLAIVAPEPVLTKVVGGALALHGADTFQAGVRQLWGGTQVKSVSQQVLTGAAGLVIDDPRNKEIAGAGLDMALSASLTFGLGALSNAAPAASDTLVHLTTEGGYKAMTAERITAEAAKDANMVGRASNPSTLYAGRIPAGQPVPTPGVPISSSALKYGVPPSQNIPVIIPQAANAGFRMVRPVGLFTSIQRTTGTVYSAGPGYVDLATGAFTGGGLPVNQLFWYATDSLITAVPTHAPAIVDAATQ